MSQRLQPILGFTGLYAGYNKSLLGDEGTENVSQYFNNFFLKYYFGNITLEGRLLSFSVKNCNARGMVGRMEDDTLPSHHSLVSYARAL